MDRLQQAIQKAREERVARKDQGQEQSQALRLTEAQRFTPDEVGDLWASLPEIEISRKNIRRNRLISYDGDLHAAPYDMLRTKILQQIRVNGWQRIALTSPQSGCGKSTTAANLAFSLGRQPDLRTMVLDFDMRRIGLAKILGQRGRPSMADVLQGKKPFQEHAVRLGENVIFGLNGSPASRSSEILQSRKALEVLEQIETTYRPDIILFDTPPLLASDDSYGFLKNVDCVLLLAAAETTSIDYIDVAERQLAELTHVMGIVLNKCRYTGGAYGYEYGY